MADNKASGKNADQRKTTGPQKAEENRGAPEGQVNQAGSGEAFDPMHDPQVDPTAQPREQVPVMVDPERPYVDGQDGGEFSELRDHTGQIPAANTPYQDRAGSEEIDAAAGKAADEANAASTVKAPGSAKDAGSK
jgi:hypothetical protein